MLQWMGRFIDGVPHLYAGLQKISGEDGPDSSNDLPPVAVDPATPDPIAPAGSIRPTAAAQITNRPSLTVSLSSVVRNAFDKKGSLTSDEVFAYLEKTGAMGKIRDAFGNQAREKVKKTLYELRKQGLLSRANGKKDTPWVPTPELNVRQNHLRSIVGTTDPTQDGKETEGPGEAAQSPVAA
jgi:hypothetical protein